VFVGTRCLREARGEENAYDAASAPLNTASPAFCGLHIVQTQVNWLDETKTVARSTRSRKREARKRGRREQGGREKTSTSCSGVEGCARRSGALHRGASKLVASRKRVESILRQRENDRRRQNSVEVSPDGPPLRRLTLQRALDEAVQLILLRCRGESAMLRDSSCETDRCASYDAYAVFGDPSHGA
jgi:hypothetical protein